MTAISNLKKKTVECNAKEILLKIKDIVNKQFDIEHKAIEFD